MHRHVETSGPATFVQTRGRQSQFQPYILDQGSSRLYKTQSEAEMMSFEQQYYMGSKFLKYKNDSLQMT